LDPFDLCVCGLFGNTSSLHSLLLNPRRLSLSSFNQSLLFFSLLC
jgi:hypothetical protein